METTWEETHKRRHQKLHKALDELLADFLTHTKALPSKTPIIDLVRWSSGQTLKPSEIGEIPMPKKTLRKCPRCGRKTILYPEERRYSFQELQEGYSIKFECYGIAKTGYACGQELWYHPRTGKITERGK